MAKAAKSKKSKGKSATEIRQGITDQIIAAINTGTPPWRKPWRSSPNAGSPCNFTTGRRYSGINPLILMAASIEKGYCSRHWGSANQWLQNIGAHVRQRETASHITFYKSIPKKDQQTGVVEKDSKGRDKMIPLLKTYPVFNVEQLQAPTVEALLDGRGHFSIVKSLLGQYDRKIREEVTSVKELRTIAKKYLPSDQQPPLDSSREVIAQAIHDGIEQKLQTFLVSVTEVVNSDPDYSPAERLMKASGAKISHGGNRAFYSAPPKDSIRLPSKRSFESMTDYYQTAFHEMMHWVVNGGRITSHDELTYPYCELVAEIGACFTLMELGVPLAAEMLPNTQSYVAGWLQSMENDPKYIFSASSLASKAVDYLLAFVGQENPTHEDDSRKVA